MLIHLIAAARPNFMKIAPLCHVLKKESWAEPKIVHTGQHYDLNMSDVFFAEPRPSRAGYPPGSGQRHPCRADRTGHYSL